MIIDAQGLLSDAQALTATAASTNLIDLGVDRNVGIGEPMGLVFNVDVAADFTTGDETYSFALQTDSAVGFGTVVTISSSAILAATLVAGFRFVIPIPSDSRMDRYVRANYTLAGTTPTLTVTTHLQPLSMVQAEVVYPDNITIS